MRRLPVLAVLCAVSSCASDGGPLHPAQPCDADCWPDAPITITGDTNRDGLISSADVPARAQWSWEAGALVLANLDDDDGDGVADVSDGHVNAGGDVEDLARFEIRLAGDLDPTAYTITIDALDAAGHVRIHEHTPGVGNGWRLVDDGRIAQRQRVVEVGIEGDELAGVSGWDGETTLLVGLLDADGNEVAADMARARVAPWLALPNTAPTRELYIARGHYASADKLSEDLAATGVVDVREYTTTSWQEMWMQDTMEVGFTEIPGSRMHVIWNNRRCEPGGACDRFAATLLGKDVGLFEIPITGATGTGQWDDWFGNVEVTPATAQAPLGRIYYGRNLSDSYKRFLTAQEVQAPIELDPTWLLIKHVDEFINFVPGSDGQPRMIAASPRRASDVLADGYYGPYNQGIQAKIDADVEKLRTAIGLPADRIIHLPQYYSAGGVADWSSPVNSVYINGLVALGNTDGGTGENQLSATPQGRAIAAAFATIGLDVVWVDDIAYQPNHGNVHCATNTLREPASSPFWNRWSSASAVAARNTSAETSTRSKTLREFTRLSRRKTATLKRATLALSTTLEDGGDVTNPQPGQ